METSKQQGLTLIEVMVTVAILAIMLTVALPSFQRTMDSRRLIGAADNLLNSVRYAQSESIKRNATIEVTFTPGSNWSYTVNSTPAISVSNAEYRGTSIAVTAAGNKFTFDPRRGRLLEAPVNAATLVTLTSALGSTIGLAVDPLSHMRLCSASGLGGYPACP
jgi:type IV fimbrial biogenesis protein FimT